MLLLPLGNIASSLIMKTSKELGQYIKKTRKSLCISQMSLALACGTGARFIIDLEKGKETSQIGKILRVINTLGISLELISPSIQGDK